MGKELIGSVQSPELEPELEIELSDEIKEAFAENREMEVAAATKEIAE